MNKIQKFIEDKYRIIEIEKELNKEKINEYKEMDF